MYALRASTGRCFCRVGQCAEGGLICVACVHTRRRGSSASPYSVVPWRGSSANTISNNQQNTEIITTATIQQRIVIYGLEHGPPQVGHAETHWIGLDLYHLEQKNMKQQKQSNTATLHQGVIIYGAGGVAPPTRIALSIVAMSG